MKKIKRLDQLYKDIERDYPMATENQELPVDYNFDEEIELLIYLAKHFLKYDYKIDVENLPKMKQILDNLFTKKPRKGILLMGKIGNGKTDLFRLLHKYVHYRNLRKFMFSDTKAISNHFMLTGFVDKYLHKELYIDDIGVERTVSRYGNNEDVIYELLMQRSSDKNFVTHASTNFDKKTLRERFGDRVYSRFEEMFIFVFLRGNDRRK